MNRMAKRMLRSNLVAAYLKGVYKDKPKLSLVVSRDVTRDNNHKLWLGNLRLSIRKSFLTRKKVPDHGQLPISYLAPFLEVVKALKDKAVADPIAVVSSPA